MTPLRRQGRVVGAYRSVCVVESPDGTLSRAVTRRRTGRVVCGDTVELTQTSPGESVIERILPRRNLLERTNYRGQTRPLAANLDLMLVVIAPEPAPDVHLLDAYLVLAAHLGIPGTIVVNKTDLPGFADISMNNCLSLYRRLGHAVIQASARLEDGVTELRDALDGKTAILVGQSGVGKSSLVNRLIPDLDARTQALSAASGQGRHTTTETTLYRVPPGGALIDSPGIRILRLGQLPAETIAAGFPELAREAQDCHYRDCRHHDEPDCAVRRALNAGRIAESRLVSFHRLLTALTDAEAAEYQR